MPASIFNATALHEAFPGLLPSAEIPDLSSSSVRELGEEFLQLTTSVAAGLKISSMMWDGYNNRTAISPLQAPDVRLMRTRHSMSTAETTLQVRASRPNNDDTVRFRFQHKFGTPEEVAIDFQTKRDGKKRPKFLFPSLLGLQDDAVILPQTRSRQTKHNGTLVVHEGAEPSALEARRALGFSVLILREFDAESFRTLNPVRS